jgi:S-DNA-T family DNA segregation ATPase FtsK/SpoIIIE
MSKKRKSPKPARIQLPKKIGGKKRGRKKKSQGEFELNPLVIRSIAALLFYIFALLTVLSFFNEGVMLQAIRRITSSYLGAGSIFLPFAFIFAGNMLIKPEWKISRPTLLLGTLILCISTVSLFQTGSIGEEFWTSLSMLVSGLGSFFVFFFGLIIGIMVFFEIPLSDLLKVFSPLKNIFAKKPNTDADTVPDWNQKLEENDQKPQEKPDWDEAPLLKTNQPTLALSSKVADDKPSPQPPQDSDFAPSTNSPEEQPIWKYPPISIISAGKNTRPELGDVKKNAQIIESTLESFGVQSQVVDVNAGPTVTQYAIKLAIGTKLAKVTSLSNDLAMRLAARTGQIRIEAPIPGKPLVGIEVPNVSSATVNLRSLLATKELRTSADKLVVGVGLDVAGNPELLNIAKMPHLLIAGQTGSGKSVCINIILSTILFRSSPAEVKFILVDPKRVELSVYNGIPHLLTPVIVEPDKVVSALKWAIAEMDRRYKVFAEVGARNLETYNQMSGFQAMPYIVIVIDELADIMLYAPAEVEDSINRLAQMARATGIHLVLATQRPSVDVITGLIKANIPARIAFSVSSMMDSRVILDSPGAEKLLGRGDMLFIPPDQAKPKRLQGAFVDDKDIKVLTDFLKHNGVSTQYTEEVTTKYKGASGKKGAANSEDEGDEVDDLFEQSVRIICGYDRASASLLQRKLSIGYNRAARIIDQLYASGAISGADGSKPREVLIKNAEEFLAKRTQTS